MHVYELLAYRCHDPRRPRPISRFFATLRLCPPAPPDEWVDGCHGFFAFLLQYCFSGDQKLQDQSQIAQDIATLYAAIPDHTAVRGVSEKGRAQFTDFKYEKSEVRDGHCFTYMAHGTIAILVHLLAINS